MMTPDIKPLLAGNWKMNGLAADLSEARLIASAFDRGMEREVDGLLCFPATLISRAFDLLKSTSVAVGGQDCHMNDSGAHTGDVSAGMLADAGAKFAIVGHSERRADHSEGDGLISAKASAVWKSGLTAIICVGETADQREEGRAEQVVAQQIGRSVPKEATAGNCIVAYEPVWAIGTGLTPTVEDVAQMHALIRSELQNKLGDSARKIRLLYGGSVKPGNALELMTVANVDGALVGGASLKARDFLGIAESFEKI